MRFDLYKPVKLPPRHTVVIPDDPRKPVIDGDGGRWVPVMVYEWGHGCPAYMDDSGRYLTWRDLNETHGPIRGE